MVEGWKTIKEQQLQKRNKIVNTKVKKNCIHTQVNGESHIENCKTHKKVILLSSTLTFRWCAGGKYHPFVIFAVFFTYIALQLISMSTHSAIILFYTEYEITVGPPMARCDGLPLSVRRPLPVSWSYLRN